MTDRRRDYGRGLTDRLQARVTPELRAEVRRLALVKGKSEGSMINELITEAVIARGKEVRDGGS